MFKSKAKSAPGKRSLHPRHRILAALALLTLVVPLASARADDVTKPRDDWDVTFGAGVLVGPSYEGGRDTITQPLPYVDASWYDINGRERMYVSTEDGVGIDVISTAHWTAGPLLFWRPGRGVSDSTELRGLDHVDSSFQAGGFVQYAPHDCCDLFLRVRHDVFSDDNGTFVDIGGEINAPIAPSHWFAGLKLTSTWANNPALQGLFGITPAQSSASGLATYTPKSGFKDVTAEPSLTYQFNDHWATQAFVVYRRLLGPAADSPLVRTRGTPDQFGGGLLLLYHF